MRPAAGSRRGSSPTARASRRLGDEFGVAPDLVAVLDVDVEDGFVPAVRGEREPVAVVAPAAPAVFGLRHRRHVLDRAGFGVEPEQLCALVAALVHPEDQLRALGRPRGEGHPFVVEGPLLGPAAGFLERPELRRAGRVQQEGEPFAVGTERGTVGAPNVEVALDVVAAHARAVRTRGVVVSVGTGSARDERDATDRRLGDCRARFRRKQGDFYPFAGML